MFDFFQSQNNPTGLAGTVGGGISTTGVSGYLNEVFADVTALPAQVSEVLYQYRKVFVTNNYNSPLSGVKFWLDAVEHPDQVYIALASGDDTTSSPTTAPSGITFTAPNNYAQGISIGDMELGASTGVWIRQGLSGIVDPDPYATFRIYFGGLEQ